MQKPMGLLTLNRLPWLLAAMLPLIAAMASPRVAPADDAVDIIITAHTAPFFPVLAERPPVEEPELVLEKALLDMKRKYPAAYVVDVGHSVSMATVLESAYDSPWPGFREFYARNNYDAVNLTARDVVLGAVRPVGYQTALPNQLRPLIASIDTDNPKPHGIAHARRVEPRGDGPSLSFVSLSSLSRAAGISGIAALANEKRPERMVQTLAEERTRADVVIAVADLEQRTRETILKAERAPHLMIDWTWPADAEPTQEEKTWIVAPPAAGTITRLALRRLVDGTIADVQAESYRFMDPGQIAALTPLPTPTAGLAIPNLNEVMAYFFSITADRVRVDRAETADLSAYTTVDRAFVYTSSVGGKLARIYRVRMGLPDPRFDLMENGGYPATDFLLVLDAADSSFVRVESRTDFPIAGFATTLEAALNKLAGQDPATWSPDPVLAAGLEDDAWPYVVHAVRQTMELDRKLFGPGGKLAAQ